MRDPFESCDHAWLHDDGWETCPNCGANLGPVASSPEERANKKILRAKTHLYIDKPGETPMFLDLMKNWKFVPDTSIPCMNFQNVGTENGGEYLVGYNPGWIVTASIADVATILYHYCYHRIYQIQTQASCSKGGEKSGETK
jgi:hypothetical protein